MAVIKDQYVGTDNRALDFYDYWYWAQTFLTTSEYSCPAVELKLYRDGLPGKIIVRIKKVNPTTELPEGPILCEGYTDGNTLTDDTGGEWRKIDFSIPIVLLDETQYAIIARLEWTEMSKAYWRARTGSQEYANGKRCFTQDFGNTWTLIESTDFVFKVYGESLGETLARIEGKIEARFPPASVD